MTDSLPTRLRLSSDEHLAEIELGGRCRCDTCAWMHKQAQTCREAADALEQAEKALYELRIDATTVTESGIEMPAVILAAVKSMARHARDALAALDGQERGGR